MPYFFVSSGNINALFVLNKSMTHPKLSVKEELALSLLSGKKVLGLKEECLLEESQSGHFPLHSAECHAFLMNRVHHMHTRIPLNSGWV